jgi:thioredoxin-related protein
MAQEPSPYAVEIPKWFTDSFLDFREDIRDAKREKRRLMVYFGQDGCPYCTALMKTNFSQQRIVEKTRKNFVAIALNIYGDRETKWLDGTRMTEKELARRTARAVHADAPVLRRDGSDHRAAQWLLSAGQVRSGAGLRCRAPRAQDVARRLARPECARSGEPQARRRAVLPASAVRLAATAGRQAACGAVRDAVLRAVRRAPSRRTEASARQGAAGRLRRRPLRARRRDAAHDAVRSLDDGARMGRRARRDLHAGADPVRGDGREAFRIDAYLRPFHLASSLEYVASGAYKDEPSFQRFIQGRAERLRAQGTTVDLWK